MIISAIRYRFSAGLVLTGSKLSRHASAVLRACRASAHMADLGQAPEVGPKETEKPEFYFENGLRKVYPYYFIYTTHTKQRWLGRLLKDVLLEEYRGSKEDSLTRDLQHGKIRVNGKVVGLDHVLDHNEFIERTMHRHELPVLDAPIDVIYEDSEVLVVNKPPSLPIHPCGRFNRNSISYLLEHEHGRSGLRVVHRLDRMTSGVLIIGKTPGRASSLSALVRDRAVSKWYLARVEGEFPHSDGAEVVCDQPLGSLFRKIGLQAVMPESAGGKPSRSVFRRLGFNGRTSLVECHPLTGRTHQLRVHLQYLGYPVANDPLYNCDVWGPEKGRGGRFGKTLDQLLSDLTQLHSSDNFLLNFHGHQSDDEAIGAAKRPKLSVPPAVSACASGRPGFNSSLASVDPDCDDCSRGSEYRDPGYNELVLFLHAARYKGPDFDFCAPLPDWAMDDFDCSQYI